MFDFLDRLRAKSEGERKTAAFLFAAFITGIIFIIWLSILFSESGSAAKREQADSGLESGIESLSSLWKNLTGLFEGVGEQFEKVPTEEEPSMFQGDATDVGDAGDANGAQNLEY